jgi:hypothetical protein
MEVKSAVTCIGTSLHRRNNSPSQGNDSLLQFMLVDHNNGEAKATFRHVEQTCAARRRSAVGWSFVDDEREFRLPVSEGQRNENIFKINSLGRSLVAACAQFQECLSAVSISQR